MRQNDHLLLPRFRDKTPFFVFGCFPEVSAECVVDIIIIIVVIVVIIVMDRLDTWSLKSRSLDLGENFYFQYGAEEITDYRDPGELLAALKQKEEEVILAAQLGNSLLLENQQLKDHSDKLHEQYADKLEVRRLLRFK